MAQVDILGPWRPGQWGQVSSPARLQLAPLMVFQHHACPSSEGFVPFCLSTPVTSKLGHGVREHTGTYVALGKLIDLPGSQASHLRDGPVLLPCCPLGQGNHMNPSSGERC